MEQNNIKVIYNILFNEYGPQGWWPVYSLRDTEGRDGRGYYIGDVPVGTGRDLSLRESSKFEISIGAILTQNTAWKNVEKAIDNLITLNLMESEKILNASQDELAEAIRPSGYFNQKAKKIKILTLFLQEYSLLKEGNIPERDDLLKLWGIGNETADSILLYAYKVPVFVVDAYTKRIFIRLGILDGNEKYEDISMVFTESLEKKYEVYQEYHALIVRHAKVYCQKEPLCEACVLNNICRKTNKSQR